jgi:hypothetical protein
VTPIATFGAWILTMSGVLLLLLLTFVERLPGERESVTAWPAIPERVGSPLLVLALVGVLVGSSLFVGC